MLLQEVAPAWLLRQRMFSLQLRWVDSETRTWRAEEGVQEIASEGKGGGGGAGAATWA